MLLSSFLLTTALSMTAVQDGHGCQEHQHHPDELTGQQVHALVAGNARSAAA